MVTKCVYIYQYKSFDKKIIMRLHAQAIVPPIR